MAYPFLSSSAWHLNQRLVPLGFPLGALALRVHLQLADRLRAAGFVVRSVQREKIHGVWSVQMLAGNAVDAHSLLAVRGRVRLALQEIGIRLASKEVTVSFSGPLIKVSFVHGSGSSGLVTFSADGGEPKLGARRKQPASRRRGATENLPAGEVIRPRWAARFPQRATRGVHTSPPGFLNDNYTG